MDHIVVARHGDRYATLVQRNGNWDFHQELGKRGGSLATLILQAVTSLLEDWKMVAPVGPAVPTVPIPDNFSKLSAFTFSTRSIEEIIAGGLVMDEAELATALPTMSLTTLVPDGTKHGRWTAVLRDRGRPWSDPTTMRFAVQIIREQIERGFDWDALKVPAEHHREVFLVRPSFSAHRLLPEVYKLAAKSADAIAAEATHRELMEKRNPRLARKRLQEQWAALDAKLLRKDLNPAERAALEHQRKAAFGAPWHGPSTAPQLEKIP
jgi:hypothetical protein